MELTSALLAQYERDGFLIFPDLFGQAEIAVLRQEVARLSNLRTEEVFREHTGGVKTIFRVHEENGATRSAPFRALVRTPRVLRPVQQVLGTNEAYVYHTKINAKPAIEGTIWMWHQDYNSWSKDGCPSPNMATFNVMLNDTSEFSGGLYIIPGSHNLGLLESTFDTSTGYKLWVVPKEKMIEVIRNSPPPVAVTGRAGTAVLFHCNVLARLGAQFVGRGPLAHLRVVQRSGEQAGARPQPAPGLGGVAELAPAANPGRRGHHQGCVTRGQ